MRSPCLSTVTGALTVAGGRDASGGQPKWRRARTALSAVSLRVAFQAGVAGRLLAEDAPCSVDHPYPATPVGQHELGTLPKDVGHRFCSRGRTGRPIALFRQNPVERVAIYENMYLYRILDVLR